MILQELQENELQWFAENGIGYFPVRAMPYDEKYFDNYQRMADTEIGRRLNQARIELVNKYTDDEVLDIGIGSGAFCKERPNTRGFDINPSAVDWLLENKLYRHPFKGAKSMTFWDSIEHIHNPENTLQSVKKYVFISTPIYDGIGHILRSKHFKKNEHCWYFTVEGLCIFMNYYGFEVQEVNWQETLLGREDIASFVFKRIGE